MNDKAQAESQCVCKECPTYFDCDEPLAFCLYERDASTCISVDRGCLCPGCPVHAEYGFTSGLYCIAGSEKTQKGL